MKKIRTYIGISCKKSVQITICTFDILVKGLIESSEVVYSFFCQKIKDSLACMILEQPQILSEESEEAQYTGKKRPADEKLIRRYANEAPSTHPLRL